MSIGSPSGQKIFDAPTTTSPGSIAPPAPPTTSAADRARAAYESAAARPGPPPDLFPDTEPFVPAKDIDPYRIAELAKLTPEIHLVSPDLGDVFLVAEHTGNPDRYEMTYAEAATLRLIVDSFPGARVVSLRPAAAAKPPAPAAPVPPAPAPGPAPDLLADWDA